MMAPGIVTISTGTVASVWTKRANIALDSILALIKGMKFWCGQGLTEVEDCPENVRG